MKTTIIVFLLTIHTAIFGQINVGSTELVHFNAGKFEQANLDKLKKTKTIFVYRTGDEEILESFKSSLEEGWDYTTLEFVSYKEYTANSYDQSYSFFTLSGVTTSTTTYISTHIYLTLWMKDKYEKLTFCRLELYPDFPTYQMVTNEDKEKVIMKNFYSTSIFHNWNTSYLKNALQFVNKKLSKSEEHWLFKSDSYLGLSKLRNDTLYIPEYTLIKFSKFTGDESNRHEVDDLLKKYPYPYKIISMDELSEKINNSTKPIYYLSYIKSSTDKYLNVLNGKNGDFLYSNYSPTSYNIKGKDFAKLAKSIKKTKEH